MVTSFTFNMQRLQDVSHDPLTFMTGFIHGYADRPGGRGGHEYIRGHRLGQKVKAGAIEMPDWAIAHNQENAYGTRNVTPPS